MNKIDKKKLEEERRRLFMKRAFVTELKPTGFFTKALRIAVVIGLLVVIAIALTKQF